MRKETKNLKFQLQPASDVGEMITVEEGLVSEKFNISEKYLPKDIDMTYHLSKVSILNLKYESLVHGIHYWKL